MTIGVFDSGIGGLSVARVLETVFPEHQVVFVNDRQNVPYGDKTPAELLRLVTPILQRLAARCDLIVIACNTVTTTLISELRRAIHVPLVGIEPMVKPAAGITRTGVIAVCATPATLKSARYAWLKTTYAPHVRILEPDCSAWARMIEANAVNRQAIKVCIDGVCAAGADVIVLGCTHYHWIEDLIQECAAGRAVVIQPEQAIAARVRTVLDGLA